MSATRTITVTLPANVAEALYRMAQDFAHVDGYGFYCGPDPRCFTPDPDASTPEERANHAAARAEYETEGSFTTTGFGLGSYSYDDPALTEAVRLLREAVDATREAP